VIVSQWTGFNSLCLQNCHKARPRILMCWRAGGVQTIVAYMHTYGTPPPTILLSVHSHLPPGKGVSSSAALEVSVMSALAAAHGIPLEGRRLALLCQAAENLVVGAPCGVMDQMASGLGVAGQLLALACQPAEVQGHVPIPPQVRLERSWQRMLAPCVSE
jgi:L-arabinokinase